jgi:hypothetical protein
LAGPVRVRSPVLRYEQVGYGVDEGMAVEEVGFGWAVAEAMSVYGTITGGVR